MSSLLLDYGRAGKLNFSTNPDKKTGKPQDSRRGKELGLDKGVPPSAALNYLCYRRSALRFAMVATVCSNVFTVLQGAAANGGISPKGSSVSTIEAFINQTRNELGDLSPRAPPLPPVPPPPTPPPGALSVDQQFANLNTINTVLVGVGKLLATISLAIAHWYWQDIKKSY